VTRPVWIGDYACLSFGHSAWLTHSLIMAGENDPCCARKTRTGAGDALSSEERFFNSKRRHPTIGYLSPMEFKRKAGFAQLRVIQKTGAGQKKWWAKN